MDPKAEIVRRLIRASFRRDLALSADNTKVVIELAQPGAYGRPQFGTGAKGHPPRPSRADRRHRAGLAGASRSRRGDQ